MTDAKIQIEETHGYSKETYELSDIIYGHSFYNYSIDTKSAADYVADAIIKHGYQKQQEAKWIPVSTKPGVYAGMKCSLCKAKISYRDFYSGNHNYCHKCGAKMIKEE